MTLYAPLAILRSKKPSQGRVNIHERCALDKVLLLTSLSIQSDSLSTL